MLQLFVQSAKVRTTASPMETLGVDKIEDPILEDDISQRTMSKKRNMNP